MSQDTGAPISARPCEDCGKPLDQIDAGSGGLVIPLANKGVYLGGSDHMICRGCADKRGLVVWS
jgi:hypothetical protein